MRIAETLDDLPVGTPIEIEGAYETYKGLIVEAGNCNGGYVVILFTDNHKIIYYERELDDEEIMIVEVAT